MKRNAWSQGLSVTADGTGVVALAGSAAVRLLADRVGLTEHLSAALSRRGFVPVHDRGRVLVDVATVLAAGGEAIADIDTVRHEPLWGQVASPATVWRTLEAITPAGLGLDVHVPGRPSDTAQARCIRHHRPWQTRVKYSSGPSRPQAR